MDNSSDVIPNPLHKCQTAIFAHLMKIISLLAAPQNNRLPSLLLFFRKNNKRHYLHLSFLFFLIFNGCTDAPNNSFQGYVEGEFLQVAAPLAGQLETLKVQRGMTVAAGDPLFTLEHSREEAAVSEAKQTLARTESQVADLGKGLRPSEIKAIEARLAQAVAAHELAQKENDRLAKLVKEKSVSRESYDRAASELQRTDGVINELKAELHTARLGARSDTITAARAEMFAARERLAQAQWQLGQKSQNAPQGGLVFDTYYTIGEFVPAGYPVISLLPPGQVKIRFFIPEPLVGTLEVGWQISFTFDGDDSIHNATISYISPQAEYTPPVIYSREIRSKLVFMVEGVPEPSEAALLHPGQPVDIRLEQLP